MDASTLRTRLPLAETVIFAAAGLVGLLALVALSRGGPLWFDEAMLYVNVRDAGWSAAFRPLPFYDQAAAPLYFILEKALAAVAGLNETVLRLPSFLALLATGALAATFPGLNRTERAIFCLLMVSSAAVFQYAVQAKPYGVELALLLLILWQNVPGSPARARPWLRTLGLLAVVAASMQSAVMLAVLGSVAAGFEIAAALTRRSLRERGSPLAAALSVAGEILPPLWPLILGAGVELAAILAFKLDASALQLANYRYTFDFGYPAPGSPAALFYPGAIIGIVDSHFGKLPGAGVLVFLLASVGAGALWRSGRWPLMVVALGVIVLAIALNLAGLFPLLPGRFSILLLPSFALLAAAGGATGLSRLPRHSDTFVAGLGCLVLLVAPVHLTLRGGDASARALLPAVRTARQDGVPLLVTLGGEPIVDAYLAPERTPGDCFEASSTLNGWTTRCSHRRTPLEAPAFRGPETPWFALNYIAHRSFGGALRDADPAAIDRWTDDYVAFLFAQACQRAAIVVADSHLGPAFTAKLQARLATGGEVTPKGGAVLAWRRRDGGACAAG